MTWKQFWNFQEGVGKAGAQVNYIGSIIGAVILSLFAIALIVGGILVVSKRMPITDESGDAVSHNIGWAMILFGVFLLIVSILSVWASGYWNKAVKKNSGLAKAGGFLFEYQLARDIFGK